MKTSDVDVQMNGVIEIDRERKNYKEITQSGIFVFLSIYISNKIKQNEVLLQWSIKSIDIISMDNNFKRKV